MNLIQSFKSLNRRKKKWLVNDIIESPKLYMLLNKDRKIMPGVQW